ncbi:hypothetical protein [Streptomyces sp. NPDC048489]|uniref:hypothetical protein n=1 Tax=Streptomyces sp. NPDC048489 TaxID=3154504 RepID=UPI00341E4E3C
MIEMSDVSTTPLRGLVGHLSIDAPASMSRSITGQSLFLVRLVLAEEFRCLSEDRQLGFQLMDPLASGPLPV